MKSRYRPVKTTSSDIGYLQQRVVVVIVDVRLGLLGLQQIYVLDEGYLQQRVVVVIVDMRLGLLGLQQIDVVVIVVIDDRVVVDAIIRIIDFRR